MVADGGVVVVVVTVVVWLHGRTIAWGPVRQEHRDPRVTFAWQKPASATKQVAPKWSEEIHRSAGSRPGPPQTAPGQGGTQLVATALDSDEDMLGSAVAQAVSKRLRA